MPTDLTALAETFARYSRQVAGLAEPFELRPSNDSPGVEPARARMAERLARLEVPGPFGAAWLQRLWLGSQKDIRYLEADEYAVALDRFRAAAEDGLRFVAACRAAAGPDGERAEFRLAEHHYGLVAKMAGDEKAKIGRPLSPELLRQLADAADRPDQSLTVDEAVAYFRAKRGES